MTYIVKPIIILYIFLYIFAASGLHNIETMPLCEGKKDYIPSFLPSARLDDSPRCVKIPRSNILQIPWIFDQDAVISVKVGNGDIAYGHSNDYNLYAVDFTNISGSLGVYAAEDGIAYVYNNCFERNQYNVLHKKRFHGLGTHVRVIHNNGYGTVYANLDSYQLLNNTKLKKGQLIGYIKKDIPLHFSVHKFKDQELFKINAIVTNDTCPDHSYTTQSLILATSVPFYIKVKYEDEHKAQILHSRDIVANKNFTGGK